MATYRIDASRLISLFYAGATTLEANKAWINDLNVFPVPDGDTGTNMTMTVTSAVKELEKLEAPTMQTVAKSMSFGSLRGARGNSGVILSQLLRGFCKIAQTKDELDAAAIGEASSRAVETAYKAVMKPKEGTILTVSRGIAEKWNELCAEEQDIEVLLEKVIAYGDEVLEQTPEMLPVLKEAGVVDSGGTGLIMFLKGAYARLMGRELPLPEEQPEEETLLFTYKMAFSLYNEEGFSEKAAAELKTYLEMQGDEIALDGAENVRTVSLLTNEPGLVLQKALNYGEILKAELQNLKREAVEVPESKAEEETEIPEAEWKEYGFIATSVGEGLSEIFLSLGVDKMVEGGQTMNPSTEDMLKAIAKVPAHTIFILPNNKNIILAAEQAAALTKDKKILVVPTKTIPEGITMLLNFNPDSSPEENLEMMKAALPTVMSGEVTYAVHDAKIAGKEIHAGDLMGLGGPDGLYEVGQDRRQVTMDMVADMQQLLEDGAGVISVYYGAEVEESEAQSLADALAEANPSCDIEMHYGGQPVYYYIVSVE